MALMDYASYRRAHYALHKLWTKAVDTPGYNKEDWGELEACLAELARSTPMTNDAPWRGN